MSINLGATTAAATTTNLQKALQTPAPIIVLVFNPTRCFHNMLAFFSPSSNELAKAIRVEELCNCQEQRWKKLVAHVK
jgi:arginine utilization protein RocB